MKAFLSIVIPAYNCAKVISRLLDSIVNMNDENCEIIVVNDGSTDSTEMVVREYCMINKSRIKREINLISITNHGPNAARKIGLDNSSGEYVLFCDSDDYVNSENLSKIIKIAKTNQYDVIEYGYSVAELDGSIKDCVFSDRILYDRNIIINYLKQNESTNYYWNKVIKRELLTSVEFPSLFASEDTCVLVQVFLKAKVYRYVPINSYYYVQTEGSLCRKRFNDSRLDEIKGDFLKFELLKEDELAKDLICVQGMGHCAYLYGCCTAEDIAKKREKQLYIIEQFNKFFSETSNKMIIFKSASWKRIISIILFKISPRIYYVFFRIAINMRK